jgi:hypothetical protein
VPTWRPARAQHHDLVGQRHRLDLVVGDVDHRRAELLCSLAISMRICTRSAASRFDSGSSNRKTLGFAHDGAADGDALALAAGQAALGGGQIAVELQDLGGA